MKTRQPTIPDLVDTSASGVRNWARQVKMALGLLANDIPTTDSSAQDVAVTFRDLIEAGVISEAPPGSKTRYVAGSNPAGAILMAPPAPTGFIVSRQPYKVYLSWDEPTYGYHSHTEIWRSDTNNLSEAIKIASWPVSVYEDVYQDGAGWFYWVRHVSLAGIPGGFNAVSGTSDNSQPGDVTGLSYEFEGFGVRLRWNAVVDADLSVYEIRVGSSWSSATKINETKSTSYLWKVQAAGLYRLWLRAKDVTGFYSGSATSVDITISAPAQTSLTSQIIGDSFVLSWSPITGTFAIDYYELRLGDSWSTATVIDRAFTTTYFKKVDWVSTHRYFVAAVDVAGNVAIPISTDIVIAAPGAVFGLRSEVVDNNVLLFWGENRGTLPISTFEIWRGETFGSATKVGEKSGLFTSLFEQVSGVYTYWVRARDSAGNFGPETATSAKVNQPPDYVLYSDYTPPLSAATLSNADRDSTGINLPFNSTETWDAHYTSRGWTKDDDAINAGFPAYAQPTPSSGYIQFDIDYGANIPATGVIVNPTLSAIYGSPTYSVQISYKLGVGDPWTNLPVGTTGFISSTFRYLRIVLAATNGGDQNGLLRVTNVNLKLSVKQKTLGRQGTWIAGSNSTGGTEFLLSVDNTIVSTTGNNTSGQNTITSLGSLAGITVGMNVEGPGVPDGTSVTMVNTPTGGVTISQNTTSGSTGGTYFFGNSFFVDMFGPPIVQPRGTTPIIPVVNFVDSPNPLRFKVMLFTDSGTPPSNNIDLSWMARGV